jgi:hypothetical protein
VERALSFTDKHIMYTYIHVCVVSVYVLPLSFVLCGAQRRLFLTCLLAPVCTGVLCGAQRRFFLQEHQI